MKCLKHIVILQSKSLVSNSDKLLNMLLIKDYISKNPMIEVIRPKSVKKNKDVMAMTVDEDQNLLIIYRT